MLSKEQVRPVPEDMAHKLAIGSHRVQERDGTHHFTMIKGLPAMRGGVTVLVVEVKVHGGQVMLGQVRIINEVLGEVKAVSRVRW